MGILKGFPPSNKISPTIWITENDLAEYSEANSECYLYTRNVWLDKREKDKRYRNDIKVLFNGGLKDVLPWKILGEKLTDQLVGVAHRSNTAFQQCTYRTGCLWFLWQGYHTTHVLSKALDWDLRPYWMNSWAWQKSDEWCQDRMKENLNDPTPLELAERKMYSVKTGKTTRSD